MTTYNPRIFKYSDLEFPGEGELFTHPVPNQDVLETLSATFPDFRGSTVRNSPFPL